MRRLMRNRMLAGFVAVALVLPAVALATHTFSDVPDGTYYTDAVAWAADNGITTGTSATTFSPNASVTRAQDVTFAHRYDQNIVEPALDDINTAIDANTTAASTAQTTADAADAPDRVVWVADDGTGDFLLLSTALASIVDASASNPYVVRIAPGEYTETSPVALKTYVDVEGSGQGVTAITCACASGSFNATSATVSAGDIDAEIRHLTINNTGGDTYSTGVYTTDVVDGSVSILHVATTATGGTSYSSGVRNASSSPSMTDVTATGTGGSYSYGVYNSSLSSPSMTDVTATATGGTNTNSGVYNYSSSSPTMNNVTATATGGTSNNRGVWNYSSSPSMTNVTATATGGTNNRGVYNYFESSPTMNNVTATATGGDFSYGVWNELSSPTMNNVTATATDGDWNIGVYNEWSSPSMTDVVATATGGTNHFGVWNDESSPSMTDVTATADDGDVSGGVSNVNSSEPSVRASSITGDNHSISNDGTSSAQVADTMLDGGAVSGPGFTCLNTYTEAFVALDASCS